MTGWLAQAAETSVLAFVTTLHCALVLLRHYRSSKAARLAILPSLVFSAMPWLLSTFFWLAIGIAAHMTWFVACELLLPPPLPPPPVLPSPPVRKGFQPLAVLAAIVETPEIRTFRLARPPGFTFRAGQFLIVRVTIGGNRVVRCYSITSAPATAGYLEISVRNQGDVSRHLHETLHAGATLEASGPGGAFVYPPGGRPIVLLAGGIGITPLLAMLRYGLASEPLRAITLILSAKTAEQVPFLDELRALERHHPQFRLAITLSSSGSSKPAFFSGRIDRELIERTVPDARACIFMICGPLPMIDEMRRVLEVLTVPSEQVHFEKFEAAVSLAGSSASGARLSLRKSNRTVTVAPGQTILEAAEATGASLPSLCRVGVCATCRTRLVSGEVDGDFDAIDASDQAEGFILACVARPLTDCAIDA